MIDEIRQLIEVRERLALTRREVSFVLDVTEKTIERWESGYNGKPLPSHLRKLRAYIRNIERKEMQELKAQIESCKDAILDAIYFQWEFVAWPKSGGKWHPGTCRTGYLWHSVFLKNLTEIAGSEKVAIKVLELLARSGMIKIFAYKIDRKMGIDDIKFQIELGSATRDIYENKIEIERLYKDDPLSPDELQGKDCLKNISEIVIAERAKKKQFFDDRHFASDGSKTEKLMLHEDLESAKADRELLMNLVRDKK